MAALMADVLEHGGDRRLRRALPAPRARGLGRRAHRRRARRARALRHEPPARRRGGCASSSRPSCSRASPAARRPRRRQARRAVRLAADRAACSTATSLRVEPVASMSARRARASARRRRSSATSPARRLCRVHYKRVIPCMDVDAGRVVKGTRFLDIRDAGDPVELAAFYDAAGRRRARLPRHHGDLGQARRRWSSSPAGPPTRCSCRSRSAAACARWPTPTPCSTRAPTRSRSTPPRSRGRSCSTRWRGCSAPSASCWRSTPSAAADGWEVHVAGGRTPTGRDAVAWAREGVGRGAGEILLTSMDRDGTQDGYDTALLRAISEAVDVPVIASGGAGRAAPPRRRPRGRRGRGPVRLDLPLRPLLDRARSRTRWPRPACRCARSPA